MYIMLNIKYYLQKAKEMYRSNSLPLNTTLNLQEDMFLIPKANMQKRSVMHHSSSEQLNHINPSNDSLHQNNALLARLLTNNKTATIPCITGNNNMNMQPSTNRYPESIMQMSSIAQANQV